MRYDTAEKVKSAWPGFGDGYQLLLQTFDEYLNDFEKNRVGTKTAKPPRWKTTVSSTDALQRFCNMSISEPGFIF